MNETSLLERSFNSDRISQFAESLASSLDRQMKNAFRPDERKTLRLFSAREVSELTGISISNLNTRLSDDPDFPQPVTDTRGHRWFSAEKIDQIRDRMYATGKNVLSYRPGRQAGDALQVLSFVNFKGGSGKSTSSCHVAQRLALRGYRVLLIDADAQASATTMFGYRPEIEFQDKGTLYDCLRYDQEQVGIERIIKKTYFHNLDLVPAGLVLSEYETNTAYALGQRISPTFAERLSIQLGRVEAKYDLVIIDCPPQLGFTTLTALAASSALIVTVVPSMLDIASMSQFLSLAGDLFRTIQHHTNRPEPISWNFVKFLLTRYEPSDGPQTQMAAYLRAILEDEVLTEPMLKSTAISDAGMTQQTVYEVDPGKLVKKTIERAVQSCNAVSDEIETLIQRSWGRT